MNQTSLLTAALLTAAPALAHAATMQAVFTGTGADKSIAYAGSCDTCKDIRNETIWDESFAGTPGTITVIYDTALAAIERDSTTHGDGSRNDSMRLMDAITSIEVKSGDDVVFSLSSPGGFSPDWGGSYIDGYRWLTPDSSGDVESFASQFTRTAQDWGGGSMVNQTSYYASMDFSLYDLFSAFDLETPFSVASLTDDFTGWMSFNRTDVANFWDGDTYLGYQQTGTNYSWYTKSLALTRLDEPPAPAPVPLPAGAPLVLTGLAALFGLRRVKRRA